MIVHVGFPILGLVNIELDQVLTVRVISQLKHNGSVYCRVTHVVIYSDDTECNLQIVIAPITHLTTPNFLKIPVVHSALERRCSSDREQGAAEPTVAVA